MTRFHLLGALVAVSLLVAACGDDDDSTEADETPSTSSLAAVERYAREFEAAKAAFDTALPPALQGATVDAVVERLGVENEVLEQFRATLSTLVVPHELARQHDAFAALTSQRIEAQSEIAEALVGQDMVAPEYPPLREGLVTEWISARCSLGEAIGALGVEVALGCSTLEIAFEQPSALQRPDIPLGLGQGFCDRMTRPVDQIATGQVTFSVFVNARDETVRLYQHYVEGERELVVTLEPAERSMQIYQSGAGWVARDLDDGCIGGIRPAVASGTTVTIGPSTFSP